MQIDDTKIPEVKIITPRRFGDDRGWFSETWNAATMREAGLAFDFVQDNHAYSAYVNTIRGLHFQAPPYAQTKLVRAARGAILDIVVDIRVGSPTYLQSVSQVLSAEDGAQLLAPRGFLHGYRTLTADAEVIYKVDAPYAPSADGAVRFDDPALGVDWGVATEDAVLSDKDLAAPAFAVFENPFVYEAA